jgi:hypothetical protein
MAEMRADAAKDRMAREFQNSPTHEPVSRRIIASAAFAVLMALIMVHSR